MTLDCKVIIIYIFILCAYIYIYTYLLQVQESLVCLYGKNSTRAYGYDETYHMNHS